MSFPIDVKFSYGLDDVELYASDIICGGRMLAVMINRDTPEEVVLAGARAAQTFDIAARFIVAALIFIAGGPATDPASIHPDIVM